MRFSIGKITYTSSGASFKVDVKVKGFDHQREQDRKDSEAREHFNENCRDYGMTPAYHMQRVRTDKPHVFTILYSINPAAKKYPINVLKEVNGSIKTSKGGAREVYKVSLDAIRDSYTGKIKLVTPLQPKPPPPAPAPTPPAPPLAKQSPKRSIHDVDDSDDDTPLSAMIPKKKKKEKEEEEKKEKAKLSWEKMLEFGKKAGAHYDAESR